MGTFDLPLRFATMHSDDQAQASQEAAAVLALNVEPAKTKASNIKKKSKGAVPNKVGVSIKPLYREMVVDAIVTQKERLGSSLSAIKNHLSSKYKIDIDQKAGALNRVLKKMREAGVLVPGAPAGRKGSGCYKLSAEEKERMTVAQKAPAKKASAAKKTATKKASLAKKPAAKKPAPKKAGNVKAPAKKASAAKKSATKRASLAKKPAAKKPAASKRALKKMGAKPKG